MAAANVAVRRASELVSQAIGELVSIGADAPVSVREALSYLGQSFTVLGAIDPATPYSIPREGER